MIGPLQSRLHLWVQADKCNRTWSVRSSLDGSFVCELKWRNATPENFQQVEGQGKSVSAAIKLAFAALPKKEKA